MTPNDPEWTVIYSSSQPHKVEIVKAVLADNNIDSFEVNKKDSSYTFMGEIDLFVQENDAVLANFIIKSNQL